MNSQEPLKISNIDFTKIVYPKSRSNQNKKIILIKYNDKNFVFQTPTLIKISVSDFTNGYAELEVALQGKGKEQGKVNKFIKFLNDLENKIKLDAQYNANSWFNVNDNQIINFQKIIRESDNYSNGTIKIKIIKNNDFKTLLQLNNNKKIDIDSIPQDSYCKMILECYAIWINSNNDFGLFFRPVLISFSPKEIYNYKFLEDSDDDNDFDMPDTEVNNIFLKINERTSVKKQYDSTSQLDLQELVKQLDTNSTNSTNSTDEQKSLSKDQKLSNISNINLSIVNIDDKHFSQTTSSDNKNNQQSLYNDNQSTSSDNDNQSTSSDNHNHIDAETSDTHF